MCSYYHDIIYLAEKIVKLQKILDTCHLELTTCMDIQTLLPHLRQEQLVTMAESEVLRNPTKTKTEKNQFLLSILPSKGENTFERFVKCLEEAGEHTGHSHLAELLKKVSCKF